MTAVEIVLIIVGVLFIIGSFFIHDKLSRKDIDQISRLSEHELKIIVEKQLKTANDKVEEAIEDTLGNSMETTRRSMERTCNEKIMAINEYSDTVLESMNKTHNEIMFLYSMLNDKHAELTNLAGELQELSQNVQDTENKALQKLADATDEIEQKVRLAEPVEETDLLTEAVEAVQNDTDSAANHNDDILFLHSAGKSDIDIAKELGLGLGEVKLVISLFKGEISREI